MLEDADLADKAEIYRRLGLTLTYYRGGRRIVAEAGPATGEHRGLLCPRTDFTKKPMRADNRVRA